VLAAFGKPAAGGEVLGLALELGDGLTLGVLDGVAVGETVGLGVVMTHVPDAPVSLPDASHFASQSSQPTRVVAASVRTTPAVRTACLTATSPPSRPATPARG
jgi:hypothetical protein